jgi:xylose isomerase
MRFNPGAPSPGEFIFNLIGENMGKSGASTLHSVCRWTFHAGKGGFQPADIRPAWKNFTSVDYVELVKKEIAPRLPSNIELGVELHYDTEISERDAGEIADAITHNKLYLAMITPGAHSHFAYGGVGSLDKKERQAAGALGTGTVDIAYGPLRSTWHPDPDKAPTLVLWNGSYGYDMATIAVKRMYQNLKESTAALCRYEAEKGGALFWGIEPKPNEGHPAMLLPTVASAILFWKRLAEEFGISLNKKGINKEFGHSEMIGLDHIYDTVEEIDNNMVTHIHVNSQGYNDGIILGGPGKYDIDHGCRINGMNIALAGLLQESGYKRWKGHDMQARPYDSEEQAIDRVVRSVLSWEACEHAAKELETKVLLQALADRQTAKAEDIMRNAVVNAQQHFNKLYNS